MSTCHTQSLVICHLRPFIQNTQHLSQKMFMLSGVEKTENQQINNMSMLLYSHYLAEVTYTYLVFTAEMIGQIYLGLCGL